ncbi:MAG: polyphosphate kinase 2 family protein [Frankiales bacterium]|nr:polyphosphate kinase 2 family protein [Frankiales bacterium]
MRTALRAVSGPVNLLGYDTSAKPLAPGGKSKAKQALADVGTDLVGYQERLFAASTAGARHSVLLLLQGMDTSGKDGVVRHVVGQVGPAGVSITSFKKPSPEEAAHHFLWRIKRALPAAGMIGVFNRSQYEDVVITRVHDWIDDEQRTERLAEINAFEQQVTDSGTTLIKCFLHISYAEQRERLLARLNDPTKYWKFNPADIDERAYWSDYQSTYSSAISATNTESAPWYIVPSDSKPYRNWAIGKLLLETLADLDPQYPPAEFDLEQARQRLRPPY